MVQHAIRKIPPDLDRALKERAKQLGKSVNQVVLDALTACVGGNPRFRDLSRMPHPMTKTEHRALQPVLEEQRSIDPELWE